MSLRNLILENINLLAYSSTLGIFSNLANIIFVEGVKSMKTILRIKSNLKEVFNVYSKVFADLLLYLKKDQVNLNLQL